MTLTRWLIMQKARHHRVPIISANHVTISHHHKYNWYSTLTACRHTVSGSISLPSRGSFHLSLTVLLRYQSPNVFSLTRWSSQIHPGFHVSRTTRDAATPINLFRLQDFHPLRSNFPDRFVYKFTVGCRCPTTPAK